MGHPPAAKGRGKPAKVAKAGPAVPKGRSKGKPVPAKQVGPSKVAAQSEDNDDDEALGVRPAKALALVTRPWKPTGRKSKPADNQDNNGDDAAAGGQSRKRPVSPDEQAKPVESPVRTSRSCKRPVSPDEQAEPVEPPACTLRLRKRPLSPDDQAEPVKKVAHNLPAKLKAKPLGKRLPAPKYTFDAPIAVNHKSSDVEQVDEDEDEDNRNKQNLGEDSEGEGEGEGEGDNDGNTRERTGGAIEESAQSEHAVWASKNPLKSSAMSSSPPPAAPPPPPAKRRKTASTTSTHQQSLSPPPSLSPKVQNREKSRAPSGTGQSSKKASQHTKSRTRSAEDETTADRGRSAARSTSGQPALSPPQRDRASRPPARKDAQGSQREASPSRKAPRHRVLPPRKPSGRDDLPSRHRRYSSRLEPEPCNSSERATSPPHRASRRRTSPARRSPSPSRKYSRRREDSYRSSSRRLASPQRRSVSRSISPRRRSISPPRHSPRRSRNESGLHRNSRDGQSSGASDASESSGSKDEDSSLVRRKQEQYGGHRKSRKMQHDDRKWPTHTHLKVPKPGKKYSLLKQNTRVRAVIRGAFKSMDIYMMTRDYFPDRDVRCDSARIALIDAARELREEDIKARLKSDPEYSTDLASIVKARWSTHRGVLKRVAQLSTPGTLGLAEGSCANLVDFYVGDTHPYVYGGTSKLAEQKVDWNAAYSSPIISKIIAQGYFKSARKGFKPLALKHAQVFSDQQEAERSKDLEVTPTMVAAAATAMYAVIDEYRGGTHDAKDFSAENYADTFDSHMSGLKNYKAERPKLYRKTMAKHYEAASVLLKSSGTKSGSKPIVFAFPDDDDEE